LGTENIGTLINGDTPWTFYHRELTVPEGTKFFDIRLYSGVPNSDTAFSWFDDVGLICWDAWAEYEVSQTIPTPNDYYFMQVNSSDITDDITLNYTETGYGQDHLFDVDLKVFLEGPFNDTIMNTHLSGSAVLPIGQPYNTAPWNYNGTESVVDIPNQDIVDWVLVEFRDATDAPGASEATTVDIQAAFLKNDGFVVGMDGTSALSFNHSIVHSLFVVIRHRNHIDIISAYPVDDIGGIYTYDFTTSIDQAFGGAAGYKSIIPGVYGMAGGDIDANGNIDFTDIFRWKNTSGTKGYLSEDVNFDGEVNNPDKNDVWIINNNTISSQVPQ
jgi:hypothetical protein